MLGGYYLGQAYLGISGWTASGELTVQEASHNHSADNAVLTQWHMLALNDALHSLVSDSPPLSQHMSLTHVNDANHSLASDVLLLLQQHLLTVEDTRHPFRMESILRIINWDELGVFTGIYKPDRSSRGAFEQSDDEDGILKPVRIGSGSLEEAMIDSGILKPTNKETGIF